MKTFQSVRVARLQRVVTKIKEIRRMKRKAQLASRPKTVAQTVKKNNMPQVKQIHLTLQDAIAKKAKLEQELKNEQLLNNKTKRKRLFQELGHLKKALQQPDLYLVDPVEQQRKIREDKERRIQKKIKKSQQRKKQLKKENRYKKHCLKCNSKEHTIAECPQAKSGFCFKCGSQDHSHKECTQEQFKFAECFVCGKKGHIARECQKNEKGLYRMGGSCFGCGSVRHTLKECPVRHGKKFQNNEETF